MNFGSWQSVVFGFVGIVLLIVCVALFMAFLEKHMRIGKRTYTGLFSKLNDNFISTCGYGFLLLVGYEIWCLLTAALLFFVSRIAIKAIAYAFAIGVMLVMHVVLIYLVGIVYLWLPCMQITGFKALEALQYSYQLMEPIKWKILIGQLLFLVFAEGLVCLCAFYSLNFIGFNILTTVLFTALTLLYCVRMEIAYFDREHIERADLKKYGN